MQSRVLSLPLRAARAALLSVTLALISGSFVSTASADVRLRTGRVDARRVATADAPAADRTVTVLVAADGKVTAKWRAELEASGARIVGYVPDDAFMVRIDGRAFGALAGIPGTSFATPLTAIDKVAPELEPALRGRESRLPIHILVAPDMPAAIVARDLESIGLEVTGTRDGGSFNDVGAFLPAGRFDLAQRVAAHADVIWMEPRARRVLLNDTSIWVGQNGLDGTTATPLFDAGIFGEGQTIAVLDTGVDYDMCYFRDPTGAPPVNRPGELLFDPTQRKVVAYDMLWDQDDPADPNDYDSHSHGTHVAGSALGDSDQNLLAHDPGDGMAPAAKLVVQDGGFANGDDCADLPGLGCPVVDLTPIFDQAYIQGARIHSNSWGDRENFVPQNTYTAACVDTDEFMYTHPDFLIVYAAGNAGSGPNTVGSPSTAKNTVSVGATNRGTGAETIAGFSSRGDTADGRRRPTITSPGVSIVSAATDFVIGTGNCGTFSSSGTSMACPTAAGLAALAGEYYSAGFYPSGTRTAADAFPPSAALLKATLINSGRSMLGEPVIPSITQGWGRVTLGDTLALAGGGFDLFVVDEPNGFATGGGDPVTYQIEVRSSAQPLKATLVWTDPPSTPIAATNLINDLDLRVIGPSAQVFVGNVFAGGASAPGGNHDRLNVEEQVLIPNPEPGIWEIEITPFSIPSGPQPYALVVTADLPTSLFMRFTSATVAADENGNGWPDPGERVRVAITLENRSDELAAPVIGQLESLDPTVVIHDALGSWPDVAAGAFETSLSDHFEIELPRDWACGAPIPLQLQLTAGGRGFTMPFEMASGGLATIYQDSFDTTPEGQLPTGWFITTNRPLDGTALTDASVEPVATSPGPITPPHALFIGSTGTQLTFTSAFLPLDLSSYAGGPMLLSFRWWVGDAESSESLAVSVSDSGPLVFPWEVLRTPNPYGSATSGGNLWGQVTVDLAELPGINIGADVHVRFQGRVDDSEAEDAFYIDDVTVQAPSCDVATGCIAATADAGTAPAPICPNDTVTLDGSASTAGACTDLVYEWFDGTTFLGTGVTLLVRPLATTTFRLELHCGNPLTCTATDDVTVTVAAATTSTVDRLSLRATRNAAQVDLSWLGSGSEGFNVATTTTKEDLPTLWTVSPLNAAPLALPTYIDTPAGDSVTHYRAFATNSCNGASMP